MQYKTWHGFKSQILIQNIDKISYIQRADLKVQKLNINGESTLGIYLNGKSKVIRCAKQSLMNCIQSNNINKMYFNTRRHHIQHKIKQV